MPWEACELCGQGRWMECEDEGWVNWMPCRAYNTSDGGWLRDFDDARLVVI